jgi:catechol 2,3-dioxygenase-like lactoylglutathione lyase family enzyme
MPAIKAIEARMNVRDMSRSVRFYEQLLGFKSSVIWPPDSPEFVILDRDGHRVQLAKGTSDATNALWFEVVDIHAFHAAIKENVAIEWGPEVYSYGRREFAFKDPDGYLIILSEITTDAPTCEET